MSGDKPEQGTRVVSMGGKKLEVHEKPMNPGDPQGPKDLYVNVAGQNVNASFLGKMAKPLYQGAAEMITDDGVDGAKAGVGVGALAVGAVAVATSTFTLPILLAAGAAAAIGGIVGWIDTDSLLDRTETGSKISGFLWRKRLGTPTTRE